MIQTLKCKNCSNQIKIDYSKAPKDEFVIGCPSCSQKYKLKKPQPKIENNTATEVKAVSTKIKNIPCPKCKTILGLDFSKIIKFPAIVACKKCSAKLKIQDPSLKSPLKQNKLDGLKTESPQLKIDSSKIDPKNNWAYNLYFYTRKISYLNKVTLLIYLLYLTKSISQTLSEINISKIDQESFIKIKAETTVIASNIFNSIVNPILKENGISPKLMTWATSWFVKKLSVRIIMNILDKKGVDKNLPYIKKYIDEAEKENQKIASFFSNQYFVLAFLVAMIFAPISFGRSNFSFWPTLFISLLWAGLPILVSNNKNFHKTKSTLIGNFAFWFLLIILPRNPESSFLIYARETFESISTYYVYFFAVIGLSALNSDYQQSKGKKSEFENKIAFIFKSKFIALSFLIPFLSLTVYSTLTKHNVSSEELDAFNKKNSSFKGSWYFLNADTTKVNRLTITSNSKISIDKSGDVELTLTAYFDSQNSFNLNKNEIELKLKEDYSFEIKYPISFDNVFEITSYENNSLKGVASISNGEKINIIASRESYNLQDLIQKKRARLEYLSQQAALNTSVSQGQFTIISDKCYFYSEPSFENQRKAYLVKGETGSFIQSENGFVFTSFTNSNGVTTEGWLDTNNLEIQIQ